MWAGFLVTRLAIQPYPLPLPGLPRAARGGAARPALGGRLGLGVGVGVGLGLGLGFGIGELLYMQGACRLPLLTLTLP